MGLVCVYGVDDECLFVCIVFIEIYFLYCYGLIDCCECCVCEMEVIFVYGVYGGNSFWILLYYVCMVFV